MSRQQVLERVRRALGRAPGQPPPPLDAPRLAAPRLDEDRKLELFIENFEKLAGKAICVKTRADAGRAVRDIIQNQTAVAAQAAFLADCGVHRLAGVGSGFTDSERLRAACAGAAFGITGADYGLADTGTLVLFAGAENARLISLLPPAHIAIFPRSKMLSGLDELFTRTRLPAGASSCMTLITGPSRTADIEQILVRGVHGPGEIYAVIVEDETG